MNPDTKLAVTSNILQIEESYRDAVLKAQEERYRKLRDVVSKLMATDVMVPTTEPGVQP